ncbi:MAG: fibronectin type III domain-containing protein, partial [Syntrophomonadaceae bacterium]|nr:fibronectin type III domain-containing protein [Syntrophomonadaceae bacterium]
VISSTGATLNGTVNANNAETTVTFEYGTSFAYGSAAYATPSSVTGTANTNVSKTLTGLTPNTTYHYRVKGVNAGGTNNGEDLTFTTTAVAPTVTSNAGSGVSTTEATLNGTVNANNAETTVTFEYGTTTAYGTTVDASPSPVTGTADTAVSSTLTGLIKNTTYHYRVKGENAGGTSYGGDLAFTTSNGSSSGGGGSSGSSSSTVIISGAESFSPSTGGTLSIGG